MASICSSYCSLAILLVFALGFCSPSGETQTGKANPEGQSKSNSDTRKQGIETSQGDEMKYQFIIANFSHKAPYTFELRMDGRMIYSAEVEKLDKASSSPGFIEFPLRLPKTIGSLSVLVKGEGQEEAVPIDFKQGKYISVVFDNDYFTKQKGKRLIIEQRMSPVVYD